MKSLTIVSLALLLQVALSLKDFRKETDWCIKNNNLNEDEIYSIHKGNELPTDNNDYSTFFECLWTKIGFLDTNGDIDRSKIWEMYYDVALEVYNQEMSRLKADAVMEKCKDVSGETPSLRALNMGNCLKLV